MFHKPMSLYVQTPIRATIAHDKIVPHFESLKKLAISATLRFRRLVNLLFMPFQRTRRAKLFMALVARQIATLHVERVYSLHIIVHVRRRLLRTLRVIRVRDEMPHATVATGEHFITRFTPEQSIHQRRRIILRALFGRFRRTAG